MNKTLRNVNILLFVVLIALIVIVLSFLLFPASTDAPFPLSATVPFGLTTSGPENTASLPVPQSTDTAVISLTPSPISFTPIPQPTLALTQPNPIVSSRSGLTIQESIMSDGLHLIISGGYGNYDYQLGPIARGAYAVGPNERFLVYITNAGEVMAIKLGDRTFVKLTSLKREFMSTIKNVEPSYMLAFYDNGVAITLIITEEVYGQTIPIVLPRTITH